MNYYKVLIKKERDGAVAKDTVAAFDVWCADIPFNINMEVKEPTIRDWKDEDGEDSYTDGGMKFSAYDMKVKWCVKGGKFSSNVKIRTFMDFLSGKDGSGEKMKMYCELTQIGRQHIRLKKIEDDAILYRREDGDIVVWSTTLRVEDPVTEITL